MLDGVEFYRFLIGYIFDPLQAIFHIKITSEAKDLFTFAVLSQASLFRLGWYLSMQNNKRRRLLAKLVLVYILIDMATLYLTQIGQDNLQLWTLALLFIPMFLMVGLSKKFSWTHKAITFSPIIVAIIFILICGAINAGLTRVVE